jgi:subtilisin-like proprotein convertase family protein
MTKRLAALFVAVLASTGIASAQMATTNAVVSPNVAVPDGDFNGLASLVTVEGLSGSIFDVSVSFDIRGGNNSDLYVYLAGPNGGFAVLLNRVGLGVANPHGYEDGGFTITLSDAGTGNIHNYQNFGPVMIDGQVTGTWTPDGRNIDPQSAVSAFDSALASTTLGSFAGTDPNGLWTLFIADLSGGGQSTLENWTLTVRTIPEPSAAAMLVVGGLAFWWFRRVRN